MLVRLSQLVVEVPAIDALEINPLIVNRDGILALDAKTALGEPAGFAIIPYPAELEETVTLPAFRSPDPAADPSAAKMRRLTRRSSSASARKPSASASSSRARASPVWNWPRPPRSITPARWPLSPPHEDETGNPETLGVVRAWTDPDNVSAEFAIIVDDAMRGEGLGRMLLEKMIEYARRRGTLELRGTVLPDNRPMLRLAKKLGFASHFSEEDDATVVTLRLNEPTDDWQRSRLQ